MMIYDDVDDDGDDHDALLVMIMMPCWTNGCIVYTAGCQTGCQTRLTTGLTTGCVVYTDIQPVVIVA